MLHDMNIAELFVVFIADILVVPVVLVAAWVMLRLPQPVRFQRIAWAVVAGLVALLLGKVASLLYQGERPFMQLGVEPGAAYLNNPGFPSDHTLLVVTIVVVVWASTKNRKLTLVLALLAGLVGLGRVLALVHTPLDVLGGITCAVLAGFIVYGRYFISRDLPTTKSF